jgi:HK97 family phage major capsid protein
MSKYQDAPADEGQPKNPQYAAQANAEKSWALECAKLGHQDAAVLRTNSYCGTKAQIHEARKVARRALTAISSAAPNGHFTPEVQAAFEFGAGLIANIDNELDSHEMRSEKSKGNSSLKILRNHADFERHYNANDPFNGARDGVDIADFLRGVGNLKTTESVRNALSVGTDTAGGFIVPNVLMPGILNALVPVSSLLQAGAGILPMTDGGKTFTFPAVNAIPTASWRAEAGALATSDPTFRAVVATPRSLSFQFKISRELLGDGNGLTEALYIAIGAAFAKELDRVGLRGSGTAPEPRGILNTVGIQAVTNGTNGASLATTKYANLFSGVQSILQVDAPMPTAAIMSPRSLVVLGGSLDSTGQPVRVPPMLEGMKLIGTSQIPNTLTVGASTDCSEIYVGDFTSTFFAIREGISIQVLTELYAGTGEIGFACHLRGDFVARYPGALAVITGVRP